MSAGGTKVFGTKQLYKSENLADSAPVQSVHGRTGAVAAQANDYTAEQIAETAGKKVLTAAERTDIAATKAKAAQHDLDLAAQSIRLGNLEAADDAFDGALGTLGGRVGDLEDGLLAETAARVSADDLKAPLASPAFTGAPTAPTPSSTDNSTKLATTAFTKVEVAAEAALRIQGDASNAASAAQAQQAANDATAALAAHADAADPHAQYQRESEKGTAGGYASLDGAGKVPVTQVPDLDAGKITSGTIDPARLPALASGVQEVSTGDLTALTSGQQANIVKGAIVTTTDGRRWLYTGTGSKTLEASYIELADRTPEWTAVANKPSFATVATSGAYSDLSGRPTLGTAAALDVPASGNAASGEVVKGSDGRLTDARTPTSHAATHGSAGSDPITLAKSQVSGLVADLDALGTGDAHDATARTAAAAAQPAATLRSAVGGIVETIRAMDFVANDAGRALVRAGDLSYDATSALLAMRTEMLSRVAAGAAGFEIEMAPGRWNYSDNGWLIGVPKFRLVGEGAKLRCTSNSGWNLHKYAILLNPHTTCWTTNSAADHGHAINSAALGATSVTLSNAAHAAEYAVGAWIAVHSLSKMAPSAGEADPWQLDFVRITGIAGAVLTFANQPLMYEHRADFPVSPSLGTGPARVYRMSGRTVPSMVGGNVGSPYVGRSNSFCEAEFVGVEFEQSPNFVPDDNYETYAYANGAKRATFRRCKGPELVPTYSDGVLSEDCEWLACEPDKFIGETILRRTRVGKLRNAVGHRRLVLEQGTEVDFLPADCEELIVRDGVRVRNAGYVGGRTLYFGLGGNRRVDVSAAQVTCTTFTFSGTSESAQNYGKALELDGTVVTYSGGKLIFPVSALTSGGGAHTATAQWLGGCRIGALIEWVKPIFSGWPTMTWVAAKSLVTRVAINGSNVEVTLDHRGAAPQTGWRAMLPYYERLDLRNGTEVRGTVPVLPYRGENPDSGPGLTRLERAIGAGYHVLAPKGFVRSISIDVLRTGTDFVAVTSRADEVAIHLGVDATVQQPRRVTLDSASLHANDAYTEGGAAKTKITPALFSGTMFVYAGSNNAGGAGPGGLTPATPPLVRVTVEYADLV